MTSTPSTTNAFVDLRREESELFERLAAARPDSPAAERARARLVELNTPLVRHLAGRYAGRSEPIDDLVQVAMLGLVKAINRFEPDRNINFASYAVPTILGELKRYFRDQTWSVHVPRSVGELHLKVSAARSALGQQLHREPTLAELAAETDTTVDRVELALHGGRNRNSRSLDALRDSDRHGDDVEPAAADGGFGQIEDAMVLAPAFRRLPRRSRYILRLRFVEDKTQVEIADVLGVSQMQVSRLISRSIDQLRTMLRDNTIGPEAGSPLAAVAS